MLSGRGVNRVDDIRRKRYIDNDVQPAFQAVDQLRNLTSEAPNIRGFFGFSQRAFLSNHRAVSADKMAHNLTLCHTVPAQRIDRRVEPLDTTHRVSIGKKGPDFSSFEGSLIVKGQLRFSTAALGTGESMSPKIIKLSGSDILAMGCILHSRAADSHQNPKAAN